MTKKRWIVLAGLLAVCIALTLAVFALLAARPGVTPANIERIQDGMTRAEVEQILDGPGVSRGEIGDATLLAWHNPHDGTHVGVYFDPDNRVIGKNWARKEINRVAPDSFLQELRRLLRL
jgi:hypothetical protein